MQKYRLHAPVKACTSIHFSIVDALRMRRLSHFSRGSILNNENDCWHNYWPNFLNQLPVPELFRRIVCARLLVTLCISTSSFTTKSAVFSCSCANFLCKHCKGLRFGWPVSLEKLFRKLFCAFGKIELYPKKLSFDINCTSGHPWPYSSFIFNYRWIKCKFFPSQFIQLYIFISRAAAPNPPAE